MRVKAPGTGDSTTVFPLKRTTVLRFFGPSLGMDAGLAAGILSPTLMVIRLLRFVCGSRAELLGIQLPQLQHSRTDVRHRLQAAEGLLRIRNVFQCDLRPAEIDVGLVEVLYPLLF